jgi:hypothetical protein
MIALVLAVPAWAEETPGAALAQVPAKAPVVLHVRGFERTKDRLATLVKNAVPDFAPVVQGKLEDGLKKALNERELKGLAKDGPIFLILTEMPSGQETPSGAVIARVTDYGQFRDGLLKEDERKNLKKESAGYETVTVDEREVFFVDHKGYAVVTTNKDVALQFTKKQAGLDGKLDAATARELLDSDVALYVDVGAVNEAYGDQLKGFRQLLPVLLGQAGEQAKLDKNTQEMVRVLYDGIFQLIEDSRAFLLAADFRPDGLAVHTKARVGADTKSNSFLKNSKPAALEGVGKLTQGQLGYFGIRFEPGMAKMYQQMVAGAGGEGDENKAVAEALKKMEEAGAETMVMDFNLPARGLAVWTYKDPVKAVQAQLRLYESMDAGGSVGSAILKDKPKVKADAETHRGFKLASVSLTWDAEKMADKAGGVPQVAELMKKAVGDGLNSWFGTDGKAYVQVMADNWEAARRQLDDYLDGKSTVAGQQLFADARKRLPAEATLIGLVDGPLYVQKASELIFPVLKGQGLPVNLPPMKASAGKGYIGLAVTLQPERGSLNLWLPVSVVKEIRKMVQPALEGGVQ